MLDPGERLAEEYTRCGVAQVPSLLSQAEIDEIRDVFMDQVERDRAALGHDDHVPDDDVLAHFPRFVHPHRHRDTEAGRLARRWMLSPRIVRRVTELIGSPLGAQSMFYFKPPTARGQALHQDNLFLRAHPETCLAVWIAVDDCDETNGALKVVPGSHRYELVCPKEADTSTSFTNAGIELPEGMTPVQTKMHGGDALFFHGSLVHGSDPNRSTNRFRRSLIFHYVPQSSTEIARFYNPLVAPDGDEINVTEAASGGACGEGWKRVDEPQETH